MSIFGGGKRIVTFKQTSHENKEHLSSNYDGGSLMPQKNHSDNISTSNSMLEGCERQAQPGHQC